MNPIRHIIASIILLLNLVGYAQRVEIHGRITDTDSKPISFATVRIVGTIVGTLTDEEGKYSMEASMADTITIAFSCLGYEPRERQIFGAIPDRSYVLNASLKKSNKRLKEVEVTEYRPHTDGMQRFSRENIRNVRSASGSAVEDLLSTLPGVTTPSEFSSQYNVRGGSFEENAVYINGTEIYRPQLVASGQQEGLSVINPDLIDNVSFSTGGFSSEYDDKMSSILDITYRRPLPFEASVTAGLMGVNATLGQSSSKFSQLHGFRLRKNTSLLTGLDEKGEYDPTFMDYQLNLIGTPSNRWILRASANIAFNDYKYTPTTRETSFGTLDNIHQLKIYFDGYEKDRYENWQSALGIGYKFNDKAGLGFNFGAALINELVTQDISSEYWLDNNEGQEQLGIGRSMQHIRDRLKINVLDTELKGYMGLNNHNLVYGGGLRMLRINERGNEWEMRDSAGYNIPSTGSSGFWYSQSSIQQLNTLKASIFIQDSWKVRLKNDGILQLNAGIRVSYLDFNQEIVVSPKFYLSWRPGKVDDWLFKFSTGLYHQTPFYKEFRQQVLTESGEYLVNLNKNIKAQRSLQITAGTDKTFRCYGRPFKLSMEAYYKYIFNYIPYQIDNMKIVYAGQNSGNADVTGIDIRFYGQFVPETDSWVSIGVMNGKQKVNGISAPMPTDRRYNIGVYFTDYFPGYQRLKLFMKGILNDGLPVYAPNTFGEKGYFRMPAYKRVDIGISLALVEPLKDGEKRTGAHKILRSAWVGFDVFNIFDMENVAGYYWVADINSKNYAVPNYLTGRQFNFTISLEF